MFAFVVQIDSSVRTDSDFDFCRARLVLCLALFHVDSVTQTVRVFVILFIAAMLFHFHLKKKIKYANEPHFFLICKISMSLLPCT